MTDGPPHDRDPHDRTPPDGDGAVPDAEDLGPTLRAEGRRLWRQVDWPSAEPLTRLSDLPLDANDLAAWLDGAPQGDRRDRVEAWLVRDAVALTTVLQGPPGALDGPVPLDLVRRARGLIPTGPIGERSWLRAVGWSCVVALVVGAGFAGFKTGAESAEAQSALTHAVIASNGVSGAALGLAGEGGLIGESDF